MVKYKEKSASRLPLAITLVIASFLSAVILAATSNRGDQYWIAKHTLLPGALIASTDGLFRDPLAQEIPLSARHRVKCSKTSTLETIFLQSR